jgi:hypothetical protein
MSRYFILLFAVALLAGCLSDEEYYYSDAELQKMLAGDTIKFWNLTRRIVNNQPVGLSGCEKSRYMFLAYSAKSFNTRYYGSFVLGGSADCYPNRDEIIDADFRGWFLMAKPAFNDTYDTLVLVKDTNRIYKTIKEITPWHLELEEFKIDTVIRNRDTTFHELLINERFEATIF